MSGIKHDATKQLALIVDLVADEVLSMSDADVLAGVCSDDPAGEARQAREIYSNVLASMGKRRLAEARAQLRAVGGQHVVPDALRSSSVARDYINKLIARSPVMKEKLSLAARGGTGLSDSDIQSILEDLAALGELPDVPDEHA